MLVFVQDPASIVRGESRSLWAKLPLSDSELVPQCQDLRVLVSIAHRQQPE